MRRLSALRTHSQHVLFLLSFFLCLKHSSCALLGKNNRFYFHLFLLSILLNKDHLYWLFLRRTFYITVLTVSMNVSSCSSAKTGINS